MSSTKHSINYKGFEFDFNYNYTPGRPKTWEDPEEYEEFEIFNITLNGIDASELLEGEIEYFEEEVIRQLKDY
jgi:hypothetical protein